MKTIPSMNSLIYMKNLKALSLTLSKVTTKNMHYKKVDKTGILTSKNYYVYAKIGGEMKLVMVKVSGGVYQRVSSNGKRKYDCVDVYGYGLRKRRVQVCNLMEIEYGCKTEN